MYVYVKKIVGHSGHMQTDAYCDGALKEIALLSFDDEFHHLAPRGQCQ